MSRCTQLTSLMMLAIVAAGCGAPRPVKYYVIDATPAGASSTPAQIPVVLLVGRFTASHLYRDDRLIYGSGPVELGTYEYDRWAEPPADMVQNLLIADLRASGQYRSVSRVSSTVIWMESPMMIRSLFPCATRMRCTNSPGQRES